MLISKGGTGDNFRPLKVRPADREPDKIYAQLFARSYELKEIAFKSDVEAIVTGSEYKGSWYVHVNPNFLDTVTKANGDTYRVGSAGTANIGYGDQSLDIGDFVIWNGTGWDYYPLNITTIAQIERSALSIYDITVDSNYGAAEETGTSLRPFKTIQSAIANATNGSRILIKGDHIITGEITLPNDKDLYFYFQEGSTVGYASFDPSNGNVFYGDGLNNTRTYKFYSPTIKNAGGYGIRIKNALQVDEIDCTFEYCGWDGTQLDTVRSSSESGLLGYDSSQADLQAFFASDHVTNGGASRLENVNICVAISNDVTKCLRTLRFQDCGKNGGYGFVTRNVATMNLESGIYLASSSYDATNGCEHFTVFNNASKYNANNGVLVVGGIDNVISLNQLEGNWNAATMGWHVSNTRFRNVDMSDNNRSMYNGIGNIGDAQASVTIAGGTARPDRDYIADILSVEIYNTGLGANTSKVGLQISKDVEDIGGDYDKNLINIDNSGFVNQDYAIDALCDLDNVKLVIGDNRYIGITEKNIRTVSGYYYELPYSNQITSVKELDVSLDDTTSQIILKEGPTGNVLNPYAVNTLEAIAFGTKVRIILKGSKMIQLETEVANISINGSMVNSALSVALTQLNDIFTNTAGFTSSGNPVTGFVLSGNNITLTLQDNTSFTIDVTTLGVDENKFVTSGALNGNNLELTLNDASVVSIDASNMINGSTLPARSQDWFISYGNQAGNQVTSPSLVADLENRQPFYNGDFLAKGEEYVWTHNDNGYYVLGIYTGAEETSDELEITYAAKWSNLFRFVTDGGTRVSELSTGVDVASRYATGYSITNNTVFALAYDTDNYLKLYDISGGNRVLIGQSNTALVGDTQTISFGGQNQPNAKFPIMIKRYAEWTLVHDFNGSETSISDGLEEDSVIMSNLAVMPGEKVLLNLNFAGRSQRFGLNYTAGATSVTNAHTLIHSSIAYGTQEQLVQVGRDWNWNTSAQFYNASGPNWSRGAGVNVGLISLIYNQDNTLELYSEEVGEIIATKAVDLDGSPFNLFFGVNELTTPEYMPTISKQTLGQGSQPTLTFAPDISDQSFDIEKGVAFNVPIALDSGSDIVNQFGEIDAPTWAILNQTTGVFNGTAPNTTGTHVIACKAGNVLGGITNFNITLNVIEPVYTNTKSLLFRDGVSSYLGGNAALVTSLERSSNGSGSADAWTIAFVFKGSTSNTGQTVFYYGNSDVTNQGHIEIKQTNHNGLKRLRIRYGTNHNHLQLTTPSGSVDPTKFQHVIVSYNGGTTGSASNSVSSYYSRFKVIIDGVEQTTSNTHSNNGYNGSIIGHNFRVGRFASGNYPRGMLINQLAIWNSDQSSNAAGLYNGGSTQDISKLVSGSGNMNTNYLPPAHYYEIEDSVNTIQDIIGTAHLVGYNFISSDLVDDAPPT